MNKKSTALLLATVIALAGGKQVARAEVTVKVVATLPGLAALAREVGGALVDVHAMALATQDPHFVDARPNLSLVLNHADLVLAVGLDLEIGWLPRLLVGARNPHIQPGTPGYLDCSRFVQKLDVPDHPVDRSMGDIHPGGNPHYLSDPRAAAAVARGIAARLSELDPGHGETFKLNLKVFLQALDNARIAWEQRMASLRGAPILGYHRTWAYFAAWLDLDEVGFLEPKPGIPPNPSHVAGLVALGRQRKVRAILQERYFPDATSHLVAEKIGATLVSVPGGVDFAGNQGTIAYLDGLVGSVEKAMRGGAR